MDKLISVGLDVGTTTTQMVVSALEVENKGNAFSVPEMVIGNREILYQSPVIFTPLQSHDRVDGEAIARWVNSQYAAAGITKSQVDTGAVIITGETSRKENANEVLHALSGFAGDFVVATAGPDLESVLAAKGAGAVEFSQKTGKSVLHIDIGGGTSNMAFIENGKITRTGCLNVGGRLIKLDENGKITYLSPMLCGLCDLTVGQTPEAHQLSQVTALLTQALEMAAALRPATDLLNHFTTKENTGQWKVQKADVISFSGGVADCIETTHTPQAFGDIGVLLGQAIGQSDLCRGQYRLGEQTIRATVIGAGCYAICLSGSTVYCSKVTLPRKNLPVAVLPMPVTPEAVEDAYRGQDSDTVVLAISGYTAPTYEQVQQMANAIVSGSGNREMLVCLEADMAKALGHAICLLQPERPCLCIDRVKLQPESFLDIGAPVGPSFPVVVKTLVLSQKPSPGGGN